MSEQCKGFWSMCGCSKCRAKDCELEAQMDRATPKERDEILDAVALVIKAREKGARLDH